MTTKTTSKNKTPRHGESQSSPDVDNYPTAGQIYVFYHAKHIENAKQATAHERDGHPLLAERFRKESEMSWITAMTAHDLHKAECNDKKGYYFP